MTGEAVERTVLSRQEADALIENGHGQYNWYAAQADRAEFKLAVVTWLGIGTGFASSALAALPVSLLGENWGQITRWIVVVLTLLVTLFSGTLASVYRRTAVTREKGRVATALANNTTRVRLQYHDMTTRERGDLLAAYERRLLEIEAQDGTIDPKIPTDGQHGASSERN